jgi:hypothetical protein
MRTCYVKNGLAVGIILLFFGVAVQPAFAISIKSSNDLIINNELDNNDLVEYVIQIVRTDEIIEHKVLLTEEEVNNLELLFERIRTDLNNSKSREETTQIYNDAAESFRKFGILPEDVIVDEIKQLMTGSNRDLDNIRFKSEMGDGFENRLCFVAGKSTSTFLLGYTILFTTLYWIPFLAVSGIFEYIRYFFDISEESILDKILTAFQLFFYLPFLPLWPLTILSLLQLFDKIPEFLGGIIVLGIQGYSSGNVPAEGWINTRGLNGKQNYIGNFYGQLGKIPVILAHWYLGITGFTGINILNKETWEVFYLGFALHVKIDTNP